jgi:hypothetical protein
LEVTVNIEAKRAYRKAVKERYKKSSKKQKTQILNEFCSVCKYSRKHAIKILSQNPKPVNVLSFKRPVGAPKYYPESATKRLIEIWQLMNYPCSVNLKQALSLWLPYDLETDEEVKAKLVAMSESTIERHLRPTKKKRPKGKSTTTPPKARTQIPLKLCKDDDRKTIGYFEADTVAHCGTALSGKFAWSLTMTDLHTGWTENRATFTKESIEITKAVEDIENRLPFKVIGFSTDNGSEFLNETLQEYLIFSRSGNPIEVSRGRPYKKNDNAHVEQKNFTHVRNVFGYERIEDQNLIELMNKIYVEYLGPLKNFYTPCLKLKKKERVGAKIKKQYDKPKTPYQRVLESGALTIKQTEVLKDVKSRINPFKLQKELNQKLKEFYSLLDNYRPELKRAV